MVCWLCTCSCDRCSSVASRTGCSPWNATPVLFICNVNLGIIPVLAFPLAVPRLLLHCTACGASYRGVVSWRASAKKSPSISSHWSSSSAPLPAWSPPPEPRVPAPPGTDTPPPTPLRTRCSSSCAASLCGRSCGRRPSAVPASASCGVPWGRERERLPCRRCLRRLLRDRLPWCRLGRRWRRSRRRSPWRWRSERWWVACTDAAALTPSLCPP